MAENTKIEWAHHTFNPWMGCTKVSVGPQGGCEHCYAEVSTPSRTMRVGWGTGQPRIRTSAGNWKLPERWNAKAQRLGVRYRVFCASLADWADNAVPIEWLVDQLELVRTTQHLDWLMLTKRIGIVLQRLQEAHNWVLDNWPAVDAQPLSHWLTDWIEGGNPPANVWLGSTICNQPESDRDITKLLAVPAAKHFLSMEPLLGSVDLVKSKAVRSMCKTCASGLSRGCVLDQPGPFVDWVIVGGESGPQARPMHPDWARSLRDQCQAAGVPFFFKQWGEWKPMGPINAPPGAEARHVMADGSDYYPGNFGAPLQTMFRVGKKVAGRQLDGRTWDAFPD